jgi:hypothetical protein
VAYKLATGVRIGPHEFSGGTSGAAEVLRRLGFEVRDMRTAAAQQAADRVGRVATITPHAPVAPSGDDTSLPRARLPREGHRQGGGCGRCDREPGTPGTMG